MSLRVNKFIFQRRKQKAESRLLFTKKKWVFWVNITKSEVNLRYRNCSNLFGILRREIEFWNYHCRNSTKSMREKKKKVERENVEFRQRGYWISYAQFCCPGVSAWSARSEKKKKNWQTTCGNAIAEIGKKKIVTIVVMVLPKMGEKKCGSEIWGE